MGAFECAEGFCRPVVAAVVLSALSAPAGKHGLHPVRRIRRHDRPTAFADSNMAAGPASEPAARHRGPRDSRPIIITQSRRAGHHAVICAAAPLAGPEWGYDYVMVCFAGCRAQAAPLNARGCPASHNVASDWLPGCVRGGDPRRGRRGRRRARRRARRSLLEWRLVVAFARASLSGRVAGGRA